MPRRRSTVIVSAFLLIYLLYYMNTTTPIVKYIIVSCVSTATTRFGVEIDTFVRHETQIIVKLTSPVNITLRHNVSTIRQHHLRIGIYVAIKNRSQQIDYTFAQNTLRCYAKRYGYLLEFDYDDGNVELSKKCPQNDFMFKRHCMASLALVKYDWMLFMDADIGVANPYHLIEEWIDNRVNIIFYDRFYVWEIATGSYLIRNCTYSRRFLIQFAMMETQLANGTFHGTDNGAIHVGDNFFNLVTEEYDWVSHKEIDSFRSYRFHTFLSSSIINRFDLSSIRRKLGFERHTRAIRVAFFPTEQNMGFLNEQQSL